MDIKGPNECSFSINAPMDQYLGTQKLLFCAKSDRGNPCRVCVFLGMFGVQKLLAKTRKKN